MDTPSMAFGAEWLSFHIHHSGNRDHLVTDLVHPTVRSLWRERKLESFFFLRHVLGGPHIRLRILPSPGSREEVREMVKKQVSGYPSSSLHEIPFEPETERYGGIDRIAASLDFFAFSSTRALRLLGQRGNFTAGEWLTIALRLLARYLLGFAEDIQELDRLIAAPAVTTTGAEFTEERADRAFRESGERLLLLLRREIANLGLAALSPLEEGETARYLARELDGADRTTRSRIFASQIHMTANRLGLAPVEEIYVSRILQRMFRRLEEVDPTAWSDLEDLLVCRAARDPVPPQRLHDLLPLAFDTL
jgi:thiopeptide-type bacteriocin biosynthesis protein